MQLTELKEWIKVDENYDDNILNSLIITSRALIQRSTGVEIDNVKDNPEALELYKTLQKIIIADLYDNRTSSGKVSPLAISLYTQLGSYKFSNMNGDNL
nr:head-tail connector protein [Clostridium botulinum]